jgi:serine/threonine-protein kinase SRPK3
MYKALKILGAEFYGQGNDTFEREILAHLRDGDREHAGHKHICHMLDNFLHVGPNGTHLCLVFELMGETLDNFACRFKNARVPAPAMRRITIQLIHALDYAHTNGVIHTGIFMQTNITNLQALDHANSCR